MLIFYPLRFKSNWSNGYIRLDWRKKSLLSGNLVIIFLVCLVKDVENLFKIGNRSLFMPTVMVSSLFLSTSSSYNIIGLFRFWLNFTQNIFGIELIVSWINLLNKTNCNGENGRLWRFYISLSLSMLPPIISDSPRPDSNWLPSTKHYFGKSSEIHSHNDCKV